MIRLAHGIRTEEIQERAAHLEQICGSGQLNPQLHA
jgi:hypothetical protein